MNLSMSNVIMILILILIVIVVTRNGKKTDTKYRHSIPKRIWTYWDDSNNLPSIVKTCIHGWKLFS